MFTGLIQCIGKIRTITPRGSEATLTIESDFNSFQLGESIAINGTCLSVTDFSASAFTVFASVETLQVTGMAQMQPGTAVNLEKALTLSTPLGGHLVTGHVDTRVRVIDRINHTAASQFRFALPESAELRSQIASKGSVTIDGVSLTVNAVSSEDFEVMIIPVTLAHTTLGHLKPGRSVNLETDILAKYIARRLSSEDQPQPPSDISMDLLTKNGFMR
jgi:riboflavin synthase